MYTFVLYCFLPLRLILDQVSSLLHARAGLLEYIFAAYLDPPIPNPDSGALSWYKMRGVETGTVNNHVLLQGSRIFAPLHRFVLHHCRVCQDPREEGPSERHSHRDPHNCHRLETVLWQRLFLHLHRGDRGHKLVRWYTHCTGC